MKARVRIIAHRDDGFFAYLLFTPEERRRFDLQLAALDQVIREDPWTPFEGRLADGR